LKLGGQRHQYGGGRKLRTGKFSGTGAPQVKDNRYQQVTAMDLQLGSTVGDYQVIGILGSAGWARFIRSQRDLRPVEA